MYNVSGTITMVGTYPVIRTHTNGPTSYYLEFIKHMQALQKKNADI